MKKNILGFLILFNFLFTQNNYFLEELSIKDPKKYQKFSSFFSSLEKKEEKINVISSLFKQKKISLEPYGSLLIEHILLLEKRKDALEWLLIFAAILEEKDKKFIEKFIEKSLSLLQTEFIFQNELFTLSYTATKNQFAFDEIGQPFFELEKSNLIVKNNQNTIKIPADKVKYYFMNEELRGEKAQYDLSYLGVVAHLHFDSYQFQLKNGIFSSDSAFLFQDFQEEPFLGKFKEKFSYQLKNCEKDIFPYFETYDKNIKIKNIFSHPITYEGGFALQCNRFLGLSSDQSLASLSFLEADTVFAKIQVKEIAFSKDQLRAEKVAIAFYFENDSLTHSDIAFNYKKENNKLTFFKKNQNPYFFTSSYHQLDFDIDTLTYVIGSDKIFLQVDTKLSSKENPRLGFFTSLDFFDPALYYEMEDKSSIHPFVQLERASQRLGQRFSLSDFAKFNQINEKMIAPQIYQLKKKGYLQLEKDTIILDPKISKFLDFIYKKKDYDKYKIASNPLLYQGLIELKESERMLKKMAEKDNFRDFTTGILDLKTKILRVRGLNSFSLSKIQQLEIYPKYFYIDIGQNRSFSAPALYNVAGFNAYADSTFFDYSNYQIHFYAADSVKLNTLGFLNEDGTENEAIYRIKNPIRALDGTVFIDHPQNKSGIFLKDKNTNFPILETKNEGIIYFQPQKNKDSVENILDSLKKVNNKKIKKEKIVNENFYVFDKNLLQKTEKDSIFLIKISPFSLNNLKKFKPENFKYPGTLETGIIFGSFPIEVIIQKDYSLGTKIDLKEPVSVYKTLTKANYQGNVSVDSRGLIGAGELNVLTSKIKSDLFYFDTDSIFSEKTFVNNSGTSSPLSQPQFTGSFEKCIFYPMAQHFFLKNQDFIQMMDGKIKFQGELVYKADTGLSGRGKLQFIDQKITNFPIIHADLFDFKQYSISADLENFNIQNTSKNNFLTLNKNKNTLNIETLTDTLIPFDKKIDLDYFSYRVLTDTLVWDLNKNSLLFYTTDTISNFLSTHPEQDSLSFTAKKAILDLNKRQLQVEEVAEILFKNVKIIPAQGLLTFDNYKMQPLQQAEIFFVSDTSSLFHFTEVNATIKSGKSYKATATLAYENQGMTKKIQVKNLETDSLGDSFANGKIEKEQNFYFNKIFPFNGNYFINSKEKKWKLEGNTKLEQNCYAADFFGFQATVNPEILQIPIVGDQLGKNEQSFGLGFYSSYKDFSIYPAFFQNKKNTADVPFLVSSGILGFDENEQKFIFTSEQKWKDPKSKGNQIGLDPKTCTFEAFGLQNWDLEIAPIALASLGEWTFWNEEKKFENNNELAIYVPFLEMKITDFLAKIWLADKHLSPLGNEHFSAYQKMVQQLLNIDQYKNWLNQSKTSFENYQNLPQNFVKSLYFSRLIFEWKKIGNFFGFVSENVLNLLRFGKGKISKKIPGALMMIPSKQHQRDRLVFLILAKDADFYFDFQSSEQTLYLYSKQEKIMEFLQNNTKNTEGIQIVLDLPPNALYRPLQKYIQEELDQVSEEEVSSIVSEE